MRRAGLYLLVLKAPINAWSRWAHRCPGPPSSLVADSHLLSPWASLGRGHQVKVKLIDTSRCTCDIRNRHKERQSAMPKGHNGLHSLLCVARQFQGLMPRGLSDRGHIHFSLILPALRAVLFFSSPSRGDLPTVPGCDVHSHTALAVHSAGAARRPPPTGRAESREGSLCSSEFRAPLTAHDRPTPPVSTGVS